MVSVCLPSDALLQHLPSYLGFSYLGHGVSLHGCSRKVQLLLLTLDGVCPHCCPSWPSMWDGSSRPSCAHAATTPWTWGSQYATGDQWRNNSRKNEGMEPKQKQYPAVDVTGDRTKVRCCKEQYCVGTWNVRSVNQGKLEVVKQDMARVNVNILGISELKWNGWI